MAAKKVSPEEKALQYLAAGRVSVRFVGKDYAMVFVQSSRMEGDPYHVEYEGGAWTCDCPARVLQCVHVTAAKKVVHFQYDEEVSKPTLTAQGDTSAAVNWLDSLLDG